MENLRENLEELLSSIFKKGVSVVGNTSTGYWSNCGGCVFGGCAGRHYLGKDIPLMLSCLKYADNGGYKCSCGLPTIGPICPKCGIIDVTQGRVHCLIPETHQTLESSFGLSMHEMFGRYVRSRDVCK